MINVTICIFKKIQRTQYSKISTISCRMETKKGSWDREIIASAFPREMGVRVPSFLKVFRNSDCNPSRIPAGERPL